MHMAGDGKVGGGSHQKSKLFVYLTVIQINHQYQPMDMTREGLHMLYSGL
jgi:hypothetical protein